MLRHIFKSFKALLRFSYKKCLVTWFRIFGPPRVLSYHEGLNADILRYFGAHVGKDFVRLKGPIVLHYRGERGKYHQAYANLTVKDGCAFNGNNYLDLTSTIILEKGVSLGPGVTINTHNRFNYNPYLEERLSHTCGEKGVLIKEGAGIKAHALITMGVTVGKNAVVAGGAVVNRDVPDNCFVAGVPARIIKEID
jgi:acetyltransferase-like isoleucine patch superfamily enzyme